MRVLVIGDACIDEYRYGDIRRVNPESTAPLLTFTRNQERLGMAYNVAANLKSFGATAHIRVPSKLSRKIRYVDLRTQDHLLRIDHDVEPKPYTIEATYDYDAIVISDYDKGFVTDKVIHEIRAAFKGPIYMDTKKPNLGDFSNIYIKINERELLDSISLPNYGMLIVTYGAKGAAYLRQMHRAPATEVVDVCGAGDVFLAALVAKHLETQDMDTAIQFANEKAAKSCTYMGTVCVS
jgi:D-beta-D-heptose 7-phosphate kinase/D-beta-D-heptose 1-phosphate adenosyltransferase